MNTRLHQSVIGRFNLCNPQQETFQFQILVFHDNGDIYAGNGTVRPELSISRYEDLDYYKRKYDNLYLAGDLESLFEECLEVSERFIYPNYAERARAYMALFADRYDELNASLRMDIERRRTELRYTLQQQIDRLNEELRIPEVSDMIELAKVPKAKP